MNICVRPGRKPSGINPYIRTPATATSPAHAGSETDSSAGDAESPHASASESESESLHASSTSTVSLGCSPSFPNTPTRRSSATPSPARSFTSYTSSSGSDMSLCSQRRRRASPASSSSRSKSRRYQTTSDSYSESETSDSSQDEPLAKIKHYDPANVEFNIVSWNVAGLRACANKGGLDNLLELKPDMICLQEVKCTPEQLPAQVLAIKEKGYKLYQTESPVKGHAGCVVLTKITPFQVTTTFEDDEVIFNGRVIHVEFYKFHVLCVYVQNSGRKLVTLGKRMEFDKIFSKYVKALDRAKPVIIAGDMNVAHMEIDLTNPKKNANNAGFTPEERDGMTALLKTGFIDSYRHLYPSLREKYTFWSYFSNSRARNIGWRLDYFIISKRFIIYMLDSLILPEYKGSDHCPIMLKMQIVPC